MRGVAKTCPNLRPEICPKDEMPTAESATTFAPYPRVKGDVAEKEATKAADTFQDMKNIFGLDPISRGPSSK